MSLYRIILIYAAISFFIASSQAEVSPQIEWKKRKSGWQATISYDLGLFNCRKLNIEKIVGDIIILGCSGEFGTILYFSSEQPLQIEAEADLHANLPIIQLQDSTLSITGNLQRFIIPVTDFSFQMRILLPVDCELDVSSSGGKLQVQNLNRQVRIAHTLGDVSLYDIHNDVYLHSTNGNAVLKAITGNVTCQILTGDFIADQISGNLSFQGTISDAEMRNLIGEISVSQDGGDLSMKNVQTNNLTISTSVGEIDLRQIKSEQPITIQASAGDVSLHDTQGMINLVTNSGNIQIDDHRGTLMISKFAGDVKVKKLSGTVSVKTNQGDIEVQMVYREQAVIDSVSLLTLNGNILFSVPRKLPFSLTATLEWNLGELHIDSSFPLDYRQDRLSLTGRGEILGGGFPVNLKTGIGMIHIQKNKWSPLDW